MHRDVETQHRGWLDERLDLSAFMRKYGRKVFPVHATFFLGEMALFSFIILVLTGVYLALIYTPSNAEVTVNGKTLPEAYASVSLIESIPVANLFRNVHHWAAHVMIAAILLHLLRIYFTGTYRKPREVNWIVGVVLLGLTLMAGFVGYALPYDAFAVTATGIGYSIARSIPWVGNIAADLFFGGAYPTLGSVPRLYTIHVFIVPALITLVVAVHLTIIVKQKHTQPGYAKPIAEPNKVLGVPAWPYQALLAGQLLLLMFGILFLLAAVVPPHPLADFGPPGPTTPVVKPDWYLLWIYGFLKIIPPQATFHLFGATFEPDFIGGLVFPGVIFLILVLAPWIDWTNRHALRRFEYLQPPRQAPIRLAAGLAMLAFLGSLFVAAYYTSLGFSLAEIWAFVIIVPAAVAVAALLFAYRTLPPPSERFNPTTAGNISRESDQPSAISDQLPEDVQPATIGASSLSPRGEETRASLVVALHEFGDLADAVEHRQGSELLATLTHLDRLRLQMRQSNEELERMLRESDGADDEGVRG
ncbi:MAG TPA: cytochrome bc complex cytochrome b subunit [Thermomicrobiales bacterium]|nr:cytochrome bc complex cytochrome b subunit [Thermomicrobiales bacterium]